MSLGKLVHADVQHAAARLAKSGRLYRTPTFECPALNGMLGGNRFFFKCENLQVRFRSGILTCTRPVDHHQPRP